MMQLSIITANAKDLIKEINQVTGKHFDSLDDTKKYGDMLAEFNDWYQKQIRYYATAANSVVEEAVQVAEIPYRIDVGYEAFDEPDNSFSEVEYADINTQIAKSKEIYSWSVLQKFFNKEASLLGDTKKFLDSNKSSKIL